MAVRAKRAFKEMIGRGHVPLGVYLTSLDPATTEIFAAVGYDFVIVDREHGPFDNQTTLGHIRAAEAGGVIPLVRVLENSKTLIQASLDLGRMASSFPRWRRRSRRLQRFPLLCTRRRASAGCATAVTPQAIARPTIGSSTRRLRTKTSWPFR